MNYLALGKTITNWQSLTMAQSGNCSSDGTNGVCNSNVPSVCEGPKRDSSASVEDMSDLQGASTRKWYRDATQR